ncbi:hypothetical protein [Trinickia mobilis]|uniref:hypothetical protein n=1 Tax=Trinickia mobilis TaxID=2816356 RepID=UPI001A8CFD49|nr:hypothetical protein [Trinickia mobilis]
MKHVNPITALLKALAALAAAAPALSNAHVKWFNEYDVTAAPLHIGSVIGNPLFLILLALSAIAIFAVISIDNRLAPPPFVDAIDERGMRHAGPFMRYSVALFFMTLQVTDLRVILTPELEIDSTIVTLLQIAIAGLALFKATAFLAGLGMIALYGIAAHHYGLFHLLDYTIFVGIAIFLIIESLRPGKYTFASLMVLRVATSFTLLWGAVEKFAYPDTFYRLLDQYPYLSFGLDREFFLLSAGFVEFACAYLILFGRLSSKLGIVVLLGFFVLAVIPFGAVDAIGHWLFAASLLALLATRNRFEVKAPSRVNTALYLCGMPSMFTCYYGAQYVLH